MWSSYRKLLIIVFFTVREIFGQLYQQPSEPSYGNIAPAYPARNPGYGVPPPPQPLPLLCPDGAQPRKDPQGNFIACLPSGGSACSPGSACSYNGLNFYCCPSEPEQPYSRPVQPPQYGNPSPQPAPYGGFSSPDIFPPPTICSAAGAIGPTIGCSTDYSSGGLCSSGACPDSATSCSSGTCGAYSGPAPIPQPYNPPINSCQESGCGSASHGLDYSNSFPPPDPQPCAGLSCGGGSQSYAAPAPPPQPYNPPSPPEPYNPPAPPQQYIQPPEPVQPYNPPVPLQQYNTPLVPPLPYGAEPAPCGGSSCGRGSDGYGSASGQALPIFPAPTQPISCGLGLPSTCTAPSQSYGGGGGSGGCSGSDECRLVGGVPSPGPPCLGGILTATGCWTYAPDERSRGQTSSGYGFGSAPGISTYPTDGKITGHIKPPVLVYPVDDCCSTESSRPCIFPCDKTPRGSYQPSPHPPEPPIYPAYPQQPSSPYGAVRFSQPSFSQDTNSNLPWTFNGAHNLPPSPSLGPGPFGGSRGSPQPVGQSSVFPTDLAVASTQSIAQGQETSLSNPLTGTSSSTVGQAPSTSPDATSSTISAPFLSTGPTRPPFAASQIKRTQNVKTRSQVFKNSLDNKLRDQVIESAGDEMIEFLHQS